MWAFISLFFFGYGSLARHFCSKLIRVEQFVSFCLSGFLPRVSVLLHSTFCSFSPAQPCFCAAALSCAVRIGLGSAINPVTLGLEQAIYIPAPLHFTVPTAWILVRGKPKPRHSGPAQAEDPQFRLCTCCHLIGQLHCSLGW